MNPLHQAQSTVNRFPLQERNFLFGVVQSEVWVCWRAASQHGRGISPRWLEQQNTLALMCANDAEKGQRLFLILPEGEGEQEGAPFTVVQHSNRNLQWKPPRQWRGGAYWIKSGSLGYTPAFNCPSTHCCVHGWIQRYIFKSQHNRRLPLIFMINSSPQWLRTTAACSMSFYFISCSLISVRQWSDEHNTTKSIASMSDDAKNVSPFYIEMKNKSKISTSCWISHLSFYSSY